MQAGIYLSDSIEIMSSSLFILDENKKNETVEDDTREYTYDEVGIKEKLFNIGLPKKWLLLFTTIKVISFMLSFHFTLHYSSTVFLNKLIHSFFLFYFFFFEITHLRLRHWIAM